MGAEIEAEADRDRAVLARVAAGEVEVFAELVERHQERLLSVCQRLLGDREAARDAAQEVFVKVFRKAASFEPRARVSTWLYRIAVNHCLNQLRRRRIARFLAFEGTADDGEATVFDPPDEAADPLAALESRRRWQRVRATIDRLPENQRTVLILARFEGLSHQEIAQVLGVTVGAVESRLVRAMRRLGEALGIEQAGVTPPPAAAAGPRAQDSPTVRVPSGGRQA